MTEIDDETVERVMRWCAAAGRHVGAAEIRGALAPLGWDELLNVRALLADPPPARPLGPAALADLARGTPPDVAAEREREGRYRPEVERPPAAEPPASGRPRSRTASAKRRRSGAPVVHRLRDRPPAPTPSSPARPALDELRLPAGRAVLEQLLRKHGARRSFLLAGLAGWSRRDGAPPDDGDLTELLDHHGLARAFAHRERDELLHALRAARGEYGAAAATSGLSPEGFRAALERLGAGAEAERIRDEKRAELRARATLAERAWLLAHEEARLSDLGLLSEVEADLRARMPEHLRALRSGAPAQRLGEAFARSVALPDREAAALASRLGLDLAAPAPPRPRTSDKAPPAARPRRPDGPRGRRSSQPRGTPDPRRKGGRKP